MPDTIDRSHYGVQDTAEEEARREAAETARRWLARAEMCERAGCMYRHCIDMADEALERAGLKVIGDVTPLLRGETK